MEFFNSSDGVRLAYSVEGSGPPVLFVLGAGCDSGLWRAAGYLDPLLAEYTCILFDHRGHGESDKPRGPDRYHVDRQVDDLTELLDHLGVHAVAFWGYSAAVSPGVRLAERAPERVWALVINGAVEPPGPPAERYSWVPEFAAQFRPGGGGWDQLIEDFAEQEPEPIPEWMKERIRATDPEQCADRVESYPTWGWEEWDALPQIGTPTLFITGALEDEDDHVGEIVRRMRAGERLRLEGKGHINAFLASEQVLPVVRSFLAAHAPQA
ncbi:MAG TPA: alpha/beta hydrolase [Gaiellaceae bacterium]|nr:alpha/beta hydrolase [Gaiellaceae bacterium]